MVLPALDRLTDADRADSFDQSWTLDATGNFSEFGDDGTSQTRTVNEANEIEAITGGWVTPEYDAAGNMTSGPRAGDGATRVHYIYDAWNRLVKVCDDDSGEPDDLIAQYEYDAANRRIEKVVAGGSHVHYFYDGWQLVDEQSVDGQGATVARNEYVWSARYIDAPIVRYHDANGDGDVLDQGDNTRYYTSDANHNVTAAFDLATGAVVERYVYTPYGEATVYSATWTNPAAPTTDGPLYAGYFYDAETGLYQVRHRYYQAELGAFVSRDPMGYDAGDVNLYRYVGNSPVARTDPTGEAWWNLWICDIGAGMGDWVGSAYGNVKYFDSDVARVRSIQERGYNNLDFAFSTDGNNPVKASLRGNNAALGATEKLAEVAVQFEALSASMASPSGSPKLPATRSTTSAESGAPGGNPRTITPYRDPARPGYNNGATHIDHAQARALGGPDTPANKWPLAAETNLRKGGFEGQLKANTVEIGASHSLLLS